MNHNLERKLAIGLGMTLLLILLLGVYWATEPSRQRSAEAKFKHHAMERGAEHVALTCTLCHGIQGKGGIGPSLRESKLEEKDMIKVISRGRGAMPAWAKEEGGLFNLDEVRDIITFIRNWDEALWAEAWNKVAPLAATPPVATTPPTVVEVPAPYKGKQNPFPWGSLAAQTAGKALYQQNCLPCHGENGDGKGVLGTTLTPPPADFTNPERHKRLEAEPDYMLWRLAQGSPGTAMAPFEGRLSEEGMWQVLTYLWSLGR